MSALKELTRVGVVKNVSTGEMILAEYPTGEFVSFKDADILMRNIETQNTAFVKEIDNLEADLDAYKIHSNEVQAENEKLKDRILELEAHNETVCVQSIGFIPRIDYHSLNAYPKTTIQQTKILDSDIELFVKGAEWTTYN